MSTKLRSQKSLWQFVGIVKFVFCRRSWKKWWVDLWLGLVRRELIVGERKV